MRKYAYTLSFLSFLILTGITFGPLVIPKNIIHPSILGMPRTLGAGLVMSMLMALLVFISAKYLPTNSGEKDSELK